MLIELRSVTRTFHMGKVKVHALRGVDLDIDANEYAAIMGPSGSGKTTLLEILGCLSPPSGGRYLLNGRAVDEIDANGLARLRCEEIGFVFQSFNLIPDLNVFDNVDVPLRYRRFSAAERKRRIDEVLETVGLSSRRKHLPSQLSGGQQQRVAIARALAGEPRFLLADEPTGNLDQTVAFRVMDLLKGIHKSGTTVVVATHDLNLIRSFRARTLLIKDRRIHEVRLANVSPARAAG